MPIVEGKVAIRIGPEVEYKEKQRLVNGKPYAETIGQTVITDIDTFQATLPNTNVVFHAEQNRASKFWRTDVHTDNQRWRHFMVRFTTYYVNSGLHGDVKTQHYYLQQSRPCTIPFIEDGLSPEHMYVQEIVPYHH